MKKLTLILLLLNLFTYTFCQAPKKYDIGDTGCSAYFYCDPGTFHLSYSPDSSIVYNTECSNGEVNYGLICVTLKTPIADIGEAEKMLASYMDYLKEALEITGAAGYGYGHRLQGREDTRGILDYWSDELKNNWKVHGWTDGNHIGILFAYTTEEIDYGPVDFFLDGFRFPGM